VATALFVYLSAFLLPRWPVHDPERLVRVAFGTDEDPTASSSYAEFEALARSGLLESVAANYPAGSTVSRRGASQYAWGQAVTPSFFAVFGARPALGRLLVSGDERATGPPPVVLSNRSWRGLFHSDAAAIGQTVEINGASYVVVGVTERGFQGVGFASEWFVPLPEIDRLSGVPRLGDPTAKFLIVWGRLPDGSGAAARVASALAGIARGLDASAPLPDGALRKPNMWVAIPLGTDYESDPFYLAARILTAAALLFLVLGASNVSGLLLARATSRDHEWAVRKAMGAGPLGLARGIVGEILPLALLGLAGAAGVAFWCLRRIEAAVTAPMGSLGSTWAVEDPHFLMLDRRALGFALGATLLAFVLATAAPLARALRRDPSAALRAENTRSGTDRSVLAPRRLLVGFEIALAVVLLVGGTLLMRTLESYADADPGFETRDLALATVFVPPTASSAADSTAFYRDLVARVRELPGVDAATLASIAPNAGWARNVKAAPAEQAEADLAVAYNVVGPGYLTTLGVPILAGRDLEDRDGPDAAPVAVVSRALAQKLWGGVEPSVGRRIRLALPARAGQAGPEFEVVGVSDDAGVTSPAEPARPWIFLAYGQRTFARMQLVLRTGLPLSQLEPKLRDALAATRADASIIDLASASEQLHRALQGPRLNAQVAGGLALAALATALLGLVALQMFAVRLRRRDLAVRMALGATRQRLSREILAESLRLALAGVAAGLVAAFAVTRFLRSVLFGVGSLDPASFLGVPLLLAVAVILAALLPARRAAGVDPARNLRAL